MLAEGLKVAVCKEAGTSFYAGGRGLLLRVGYRSGEKLLGWGLGRFAAKVGQAK